MSGIVFSVNLVFKEELNLLQEISEFKSRCGGLKLRGTDSLWLHLYLMRLLYHYHQLFIVIERENISCVLDRVSFIELLATFNLYYNF